MKSLEIKNWIDKPKNKQILLSFSEPKTPKQAGMELGIKKLVMKPYLTKNLVTCLNKEARKGRLYTLTNKARKLLKLPNNEIGKTNFDLIGWVKSSMLQRAVVLKTLSMNSTKLISEKIRMKSANQNPCLSRGSTKAILNELVEKGLADTEMGNDRMRYYWITDLGTGIAGKLH